ncbi:MAG: EAL domain-containing protein [Betaproteobacteria bacterium]
MGFSRESSLEGQVDSWAPDRRMAPARRDAFVLGGIRRSPDTEKTNTHHLGVADETVNVDAELLFPGPPPPAEDNQSSRPAISPLKPWKLAIVDDEPDMHAVSAMVLRGFEFKGRRLEILNEYSAAGAMRLLKAQPDVAVLLLDVVMETDHAGLDVVKFVRENLDNHMVRIILRTGQPGLAPENKVISDYDINDYKDKTELTAQKLLTCITTALRTYDDLETIRELSTSKQSLERMVRERTDDLEQANQKLEREMTDRLRVMESLRRNQRVLAEAQRIAKVGNFEWDPAGDDMSWSNQVYCILGIPDHKTSATFSGLMKRIPVLDREVMERAIRSAAAHSSKFDIEHAITRDNGRPGFVRQQGEISFDATRGVKRVVGILQDITEQRAITETMRKLSVAVEQTADSVIITDKGGVIEYVNPAFSSLTGYSREEALGRTPAILNSGKQPEVYFQRLWQAILDGGVFSDVMVNQRKDGSLFYEAKTITPQKNSVGAITHFISTGKDITERMLTQERIEHMAHHDALTGLPNRVLLVDRLEQAISRSKWRNRHVAVLFLDMDRFKLVNDTLGHGGGDKILKIQSQRLLECLREGDTVARLGGDEFAIVLNDIADREDIALIARKILQATQSPVTIDNHELILTTSIGISVFPEDAQDGQALIKRADVAMYNAKARGKDQYAFYTPQDEAKSVTRLSLETSLRQALERKEFLLHYQPLIDVGSGKIIGMEALLRWRRPDGVLVPPMDFIPLLEETGLISPVGRWVMHTACLEARSLLDAGFALQRVAVNVSLNQFRLKSFVRETEEILVHSGLASQCLELELTEGILINDVKETVEILERFHELGILLSIDDFGTGYSSMNYLRRLPFDSLKIDRSFIKGIPDSADDCAIVTAIIALAHSMNLEIVAEGVETPEQLAFVGGLACQRMQGYLCSPPLPSEGFRALLAKIPGHAMDNHPAPNKRQVRHVKPA